MKNCVWIAIVAGFFGCDGPARVAVTQRESALSGWPDGVEEPESGMFGAEIATPTFYPDDARVADRDGDGFEDALDHDDDNPLAYPGAEEVPCNGVDEDGDTADPCSPDVDGDGVRADLDCDDLNSNVRPLLPEIRCNDADENCDGVDDCDRDGDGELDRDELEREDGDADVEANEHEPDLDYEP